MARPRRSTDNAADLHRSWLELVDTDGPFLAVPPLKRVWSNGIPDFRKAHTDQVDVLVDARKAFEAAWEAYDRVRNESNLDKYRTARDVFVETVLRDVIGWAESLHWGPVAGVEAQSPNRAVTVTPQGALVGSDGMGVIVYVVDPVNSLREVPGDLWAATPIDRLEEMLRNSGIEIGLVTDGRWWAVVRAAEGKMPASGVFDSLTWTEEPRVRDALFTILSRQHIIGGDPAERLPVLFDESIAAAEEITEALGAQVRRAVELLIQSFSESAADALRRGNGIPLPARPHDTYEAAVTVMMRTVFLLFAEERGLLPSGVLFGQGYGILGELDRLTARETEEGEEALDDTSLTWHRLLATSQALFAGAAFESLRMPAYGGSLFDPDRFPFFHATTDHGELAVTVPDRVMLHVLRSVQVAVVQGEARRISFSDVDVEQIGYIYEGLLGYTCVNVDQPFLGLIGSSGTEPEIPLAKLEEFATASSDLKKLAAAIIAWISDGQPSAIPPSAAALAKALGAKPHPSAISTLVGGNEDLIKRISPWLGAVRTDLRGHPIVVLDGGLMVKETPSRRNAGAHYTPRSLAEEVVFYALQPLCFTPGPHQTADESAWVPKSSDELLSLKVADIACGSGAFLVAAARYLGRRVSEAWAAEDPSMAHRNDLYLRAVRQVVANCLYGADINDMAVEMCKLSLWLVSLDRDLPFSFVDDKVFLGNSLLGLTDLQQLRNLHIDPKRVTAEQRFDIFEVDIDSIIKKAVGLRERLATEIDEDDPARNSAAKRRQLAEFHKVTADLRRMADGVVAAGLPTGGKPSRSLDKAYNELRLAMKKAHPGPEGSAPDSAMLDGIIDRGLTPTVATDYERWRPLHWVLEAPDVIVEHGGFDAIIGNPPFLGGKKVSGAVGTEVREWLVNVVADGVKGNADLVAFFFRRALGIAAASGQLGLIATNTVAQGDTREVGLDQMVSLGFTITRAIRSAPWPASSASLEYAAVWGTCGTVEASTSFVCDGERVEAISSLLEAGTGLLPSALTANVGVAFVGVNMNGTGFELPPNIAAEMLNEDPRNSDVLFPVLGGEDLNQTPSLEAPMWAVDFYDLEADRASTYRRPFAWVEEHVEPHRATLTKKPKLLRRWWRYERDAVAMRAATSGLDVLLAIAITSKSLMPVRVPARQIFTHSVTVFATSSHAIQAILSSTVHQLWAIKYGSGMRTDPRYVPSDVFETFPRPAATETLDEVGRRLDLDRREIMERRGLGLTRLYNLVNDHAVGDAVDPDVSRLRAIHVELDRAVMDAYGWSDIALDHGFHTYRQMERWTVNPTARETILARLLDENRRRAETERAVGSRPAKRPTSQESTPRSESLF